MWTKADSNQSIVNFIRAAEEPSKRKALDLLGRLRLQVSE
jgi:hypothetical protein